MLLPVRARRLHPALGLGASRSDDLPALSLVPLDTDTLLPAGILHALTSRRAIALGLVVASRSRVPC